LSEEQEDRHDPGCHPAENTVGRIEDLLEQPSFPAYNLVISRGSEKTPSRNNGSALLISAAILKNDMNINMTRE
jgi:hypothetical protein